MSVPKAPKEVAPAFIHAKEHYQVPTMGSNSLKLTSFKQGKHGGHAQPGMLHFIAMEVPLYQKNKTKRVLGPWKLKDSSI